MATTIDITSATQSVTTPIGDDMRKTCSRCGIDKELTEFYKGQGNRDGYMTDCKLCRKIAFPSQTPARMLQRTYEKRLRNRRYLYDHLLDHPCVDCGEADPIVLEFDHVRGTKLLDVGKLAHNTRSLKVIEDEIAKCDVVCSNCHKRRTAKAQQWDKGLAFLEAI